MNKQNFFCTRKSIRRKKAIKTSMLYFHSSFSACCEEGSWFSTRIYENWEEFHQAWNEFLNNIFWVKLSITKAPINVSLFNHPSIHLSMYVRRGKLVSYTGLFFYCNLATMRWQACIHATLRFYFSKFDILHEFACSPECAMVNQCQVYGCYVQATTHKA